MFAAKKKKPASGGWKLGLVPTTLLIALVFGSGYGYYVWLQIQPPAQARVVQRTLPPQPPFVIAPIAPAAPALVPFIPPQESAPPAQAKPQQAPQPVITARNEDFDAPRNKPKAARHYRQPDETGIDVQRKTRTDTVTPALLDAYHAYQRGDYGTAKQGYHEVLSQDARNRDAMLGLAAIAQQQNQQETAQYYYRQLLVLDPKDPIAQSALISYAPDSGNTESHLKTLLAEHPRSGDLNFALGNYYSDISSWGEAQQYYFSAHTLEPANAQFAFNLAVSLDHLGKRKLAAQFYQQALQLDVSGHSGFDHEQAQQRLNELTAAN